MNNLFSITVFVKTQKIRQKAPRLKVYSVKLTNQLPNLEHQFPLFFSDWIVFKKWNFTFFQMWVKTFLLFSSSNRYMYREQENNIWKIVLKNNSSYFKVYLHQNCCVFFLIVFPKVVLLPPKAYLWFLWKQLILMRWICW